MNKYKKLAGNTLIFAIGSFSSKFLTFLLMPLYTSIMPPTDFGEADLILTAANLIAPIAMLTINEAIIRFTIERSIDRKAIFTAGFATVAGGALILLACLPLMKFYPVLSPHLLLIFMFVLSNNMRSLCASFCRGSGYVRLFAFDGVFTTFMTVVCNVLFLAVFKMGFIGIIAGTMAANCLSVMFYFWAVKLHRFIKIRYLRRGVFREMYRYCVPLIPTTLFWWITNVSDRYMIEYFCGKGMNGLYAVAYKVPNLLMVASGIFYQAWLMSAAGEFGEGEQSSRFYSRVTQTYISLIFLAGSGMMLIGKPLIFLLAGGKADYLGAGDYVPMLLMSEVFSTFVTFFGAFYAAAKKNAMVPVTILLGAVINIILNLLLIPKYGPLGAAAATFASYLAVFILRLFDVKRFVNVVVSYPALILSSLLLGAQAYLSPLSPLLSYGGQAAILLIMLIINLKYLMPVARVIVSRLRASA